MQYIGYNWVVGKNCRKIIGYLKVKTMVKVVPLDGWKFRIKSGP